MKRYRFFYHYNRINKKMSVHFKGTCHIVSNVVCWAPCETKWSNKQPRLVMRGFTTDVLIQNNDVAVIS